MKTLIRLIFISSLILINQGFTQRAKHNSSWLQPQQVPKNEIKLSIIYEGTIQIQNAEVNSYSISWEDTIGMSQGFQPYNRPNELKVVVRDKDTIVGKYTGSSTQMTHCNFSTNSKDVSIHFWLGKNKFFSVSTYSVQDNSITRIYGDSVNKVSLTPVILNVVMQPKRHEYAELKVDLTNVMDGVVDHYDKRKIVLEPNPNIVLLNYINKGALDPNPMPILGPTYKNSVALNRYLLNRETGKIKKGKNWIRFKGVRKCCDIEFAIIDPHLPYTDNSGKVFLGESLIKQGKLESKNFQFNAFKTPYERLPY